MAETVGVGIVGIGFMGMKHATARTTAKNQAK